MRIFLFLFLFFTFSIAHANGYQTYVKLDTFLISESVSINAADNNWNGRYTFGGRGQSGSLWLESGVKKDNWGISALYREEIQLRYHPDTADFYHAIENTHQVEAGRSYIIELEMQRFRAKGIRLSRDIAVKKELQLELGLSLFKASNLLNGTIKGVATANSKMNYNYNAAVNLHYNQDKLFGRSNVKAPSGIGASVDLQLDWQASEQLRLSSKVRDLTGIIFWKNAPFTKAQINSNVIGVNSDGFVEISPVLTGNEGYQDYTQNLDTYGTLDFHYQLLNRPYAILLNSKHYANFSLTGLGVERTFDNYNISTVIWSKIQVLEVAFHGKNFNASLSLDNLNLNKNKVFGLSVGFNEYF